MQEQSLDHCQAYPQKVQTWDQRMDEQARSMEPRSDPLSEFPPQPRCGQDARRHPSGFDFRGQLYRITRVDLTQIEGLELQTAQTIISEVGLGSRRWQTEIHFASWLALGPGNRINGKVLNRPSTAVRLTTSAPKPNCFGS